MAAPPNDPLPWKVSMRFPLLDGFLMMVWFFLWILWIIVMVMIVTDIFRSRDLKAKAKILAPVP
jgi:uncharacterized membrane protein